MRIWKCFFPLINSVLWNYINHLNLKLYNCHTIYLFVKSTTIFKINHMQEFLTLLFIASSTRLRTILLHPLRGLLSNTGIRILLCVNLAVLVPVKALLYHSRCVLMRFAAHQLERLEEGVRTSHLDPNLVDEFRLHPVWELLEVGAVEVDRVTRAGHHYLDRPSRR